MHRERDPKATAHEKPGTVRDTLTDLIARLERHSKAADPRDGQKGESRGRSSHQTAKHPEKASSETQPPQLEPGRYEGHLAEFPVFILDRRRRASSDRRALTYTDTIRGAKGAIPRRWEAWPGRMGFGGPSTAALFYELVQLYVEQGAEHDHIHFKTLNALFCRLHPGATQAAQKDYGRLRRDLDILCGYRFVCENAFYDRERRAYLHMREWSLFTGWTGYTKIAARAGQAFPYQEELPFGAVGVSPVLRTIARNRGLFCIGFESKLFRHLKPLEQRLAVYLAKMFVSQTTHKRFIEELAAALPINVDPKRLDNVRTVIRRAAQGLLDNGVPILRSYRIEQSSHGRWLVTFQRAQRPRQDYGARAYAGLKLSPAIELLVDEMVAFTSSPQSRPWFTSCVTRLGAETGYFCFAQLKEACGVHKVGDRGALLTKIFQDAARQQNRKLH